MPTVAIIGSGVSGLTAAYVLRNTHSVTLFEQDDRLGGHAHTHELTDSQGRAQHVDSGFIVHNERTYPHLLRIFGELGIATQDTEMSMSIRCDGCGLAYAGGRGAKGIFAQRRRLFDPRFLRMLLEVPRFHRAARALLANGAGANLSWGEFLDQGRYSQYFIRHFAVPLVSCVWSSGDDDTLQYPARHLFAFLDHHGLLSIGNSPAWRTVVGGSATYVRAITQSVGQVRSQTKVTQVMRQDDGVVVTAEDGSHERFDYAIIATHADQALALLGDASSEERAALAAVTYSRNQTWLHTDTSPLPIEAGARASWNYRMHACTGGSENVLVSYWMNHLMRLTSSDQYIVTLNANGSIAEDSVIARMEYSHPVFTQAAVNAATVLRHAGGARLAFAGAHLGWGFHEDGARSGIEAARKFGAQW